MKGSGSGHGRGGRQWIILAALPLWLGISAAGLAPAWADIFVRKQADGTLQFTNCPLQTDWRVYISERPRSHHAALDDTRRAIDEIARIYGVEPGLVRGISQVESGFDPHALSNKGAVGLMQVLPATALEMGFDDPWDPIQNINAGTKYISQLLRRYKGDLAKALAAYNAGPTVVDVCDGIPPYEETRNYVKHVLALIDTQGGE